MARSTYWSAWALLLAFGCGPSSGADDGGESAQGTAGSATDATGTGTDGPGISDSGGPHDSTNAGSLEGGAGSSSSSEPTTGDESDSAAGWPDCPDVHEGDLSINDETDLGALATTGRVTGGIDVAGYSGPDLQFFSCLHAVEGTVLIRNNPNLTSLSGLENLEEFDGLLWVLRNPSMTSLEGLGEVTSLSGLAITGNDSLLAIDLNQLEELGSLHIGNCPFGPGEGELADNPNIENLDGLSGLQSVYEVVIGSQSSLVSLGRLHEIAAAGGFSGSLSTFNYNSSLPYEEIEILEQLSGYDLYSCGNLGEPERNWCYCDNPG